MGGSARERALTGGVVPGAWAGHAERMPRRQVVPDQLKVGPITIADAERVGLERHQLRPPNWRRIDCGAYVWAGLALDRRVELAALLRRLPSGCVFSGQTAAGLLGFDAGAGADVEVTAPPGVSVRRRPGLAVHVARLDPADVVTHRSLPLTGPLRTCFDLGRRLPLVDAVAALDSAIQRRVAAIEALRSYVGRQPPLRGLRAARRAAELAEAGVESPMESRLRMILVLGGLPPPRVQVELRGPHGEFLARPDLLYPTARLAIEYDGAAHRDTLVTDNRRQNRLLAAGYSLLRYTASDVYGRPDAILEDVRRQLGVTRPPGLAGT